ncbi:methyl-accepting chemotaxis protein [Microvirga arsenatis]|uniref:Chemotaxis protein n=1 Tax=Microvirga arsenatis TaxID=2692265 RepID=A0ABW9YT04_9HYPH|nr:methyl-accepting chemotaxis protein [Microvirga arsenatis]NBJ10196.1 chemotaxis protein [Microvirga arsenatis]NBJ23264.1 chemotaxis protein [Microvirga arsenatis]
MFSILRRSPQAVLPDGEAQLPAEETPVHIGREPRLETEVVDSLEADILKAIQGVTQAIAVAAADVAAVEKDLADIRSHAAELATAGRTASEETLSLASSTEELAVTSGEIARAMDHAGSRIESAVQAAQKASALIMQLSAATSEIVGIVDTISAVARQTNLLALNATIEAARAGEAGKGFAVVAGEVKTLSTQTAKAADDIRQRIDHLRETAQASTGAVTEVVEAVEGVRPVFDTVRHAVKEQNTAIGEASRLAEVTSSSVGGVSARAGEVDAVSRNASERAHQADRATKTADGLAKALGQRFVTVMRQSEIGDRRRADRLPVDRPATFWISERSAPSRLIDVSAGGVLLASIPNMHLVPGLRGEIDIQGVGRFGARIVGMSAMGLHCAFDGLTGEAQARIDGFIADVETTYRPRILLAQETARQVEFLIEQAVADGRLPRESVFDTDYRLLPGTDPVQYATSYLPVFERLLPPILEKVLASDSAMAFCLAIDRNGYIPVHNRVYSQPQRPGDPVWNAANSRNKRIFDDRAGITAARSTRPFTVQAYARDMGGGKVVMMQEVDAPIRVLGRHWGGLRTAYRA